MRGASLKIGGCVCGLTVTPGQGSTAIHPQMQCPGARVDKRQLVRCAAKGLLPPFSFRHKEGSGEDDEEGQLRPQPPLSGKPVEGRRHHQHHAPHPQKSLVHEVSRGGAPRSPRRWAEHQENGDAVETPSTISSASVKSSYSTDSMQSRRAQIDSCWFDFRDMFVDPDGRTAYYWMALVTVAVVYNWIVIILRVAFDDVTDTQPVASSVFRILDIVADVIFLADVAIQSRTAYLEDGYLVQDLRQTMRHYRSQPRFTLDVLSILPVTTVYGIASSIPFVPFPRTKDMYSPAFRCLRLLKYPSMNRFFEKTDSRTNNPNLLRAFKLSLHLWLVIHWIGCFYYLLSKHEGLGTNDWVYPLGDEFDSFQRKYVLCMFWSTMTLTTIGERPSPVTDIEYMFTGMTFLIGVFVFAAVVGNVGDVISNMNAARHDFQGRMDQIKFYLHHRDVPEHIQDRIKRWADYTWTRTKAIDEHSVLQLLPSRLRTEVAIHVHLNTLKKVRIFDQCEEGLLRELVLKLRSSIYSPGEYICRIGEVGREMYIIDHGRVEILFPDPVTGQTKQVAVMTPGNYFGEISLLKLDDGQNKRTADVRSIGFSELLCLSRRDLMAALMEYPEAKQILEQHARQRMQQTKYTPPSDSKEASLLAAAIPVSSGRRSAKTVFAEVMKQEGFSKLLSTKASQELTEMKQILKELREIKNHLAENTAKQLAQQCLLLEARLKEKDLALQETRSQLLLHRQSPSLSLNKLNIDSPSEISSVSAAMSVSSKSSMVEGVVGKESSSLKYLSCSSPDLIELKPSIKQQVCYTPPASKNETEAVDNIIIQQKPVRRVEAQDVQKPTEIALSGQSPMPLQKPRKRRSPPCLSKSPSPPRQHYDESYTIGDKSTGNLQPVGAEMMDGAYGGGGDDVIHVNKSPSDVDVAPANREKHYRPGDRSLSREHHKPRQQEVCEVHDGTPKSAYSPVISVMSFCSSKDLGSHSSFEVVTRSQVDILQGEPQEGGGQDADGGTVDLEDFPCSLEIRSQVDTSTSSSRCTCTTDDNSSQATSSSSNRSGRKPPRPKRRKTNDYVVVDHAVITLGTSPETDDGRSVQKPLPNETFRELSGTSAEGGTEGSMCSVGFSPPSATSGSPCLDLNDSFESVNCHDHRHRVLSEKEFQIKDDPRCAIDSIAKAVAQDNQKNAAEVYEAPQQVKRCGTPYPDGDDTFHQGSEAQDESQTGTPEVSECNQKCVQYGHETSEGDKRTVVADDEKSTQKVYEVSEEGNSISFSCLNQLFATQPCKQEENPTKAWLTPCFQQAKNAEKSSSQVTLTSDTHIPDDGDVCREKCQENCDVDGTERVGEDVRGQEEAVTNEEDKDADADAPASPTLQMKMNTGRLSPRRATNSAKVVTCKKLDDSQLSLLLAKRREVIAAPEQELYNTAHLNLVTQNDNSKTGTLETLSLEHDEGTPQNPMVDASSSRGDPFHCDQVVGTVHPIPKSFRSPTRNSGEIRDTTQSPTNPMQSRLQWVFSEADFCDKPAPERKESGDIPHPRRDTAHAQLPDVSTSARTSSWKDAGCDTQQFNKSQYSTVKNDVGRPVQDIRLHGDSIIVYGAVAFSHKTSSDSASEVTKHTDDRKASVETAVQARLKPDGDGLSQGNGSEPLACDAAYRDWPHPVLTPISKSISSKKSRRGRNRDTALEMAMFPRMSLREDKSKTPPTEGSNLVREASPVIAAERERGEVPSTGRSVDLTNEEYLATLRRRFSASRYRWRGSDFLREANSETLEKVSSQSMDSQSKIPSPRKQYLHSEKFVSLVTLLDERKSRKPLVLEAGSKDISPPTAVDISLRSQQPESMQAQHVKISTEHQSNDTNVKESKAEISKEKNNEPVRLVTEKNSDKIHAERDTGKPVAIHAEIHTGIPVAAIHAEKHTGKPQVIHTERKTGKPVANHDEKHNGMPVAIHAEKDTGHPAAENNKEKSGDSDKPDKEKQADRIEKSDGNVNTSGQPVKRKVLRKKCLIKRLSNPYHFTRTDMIKVNRKAVQSTSCTDVSSKPATKADTNSSQRCRTIDARNGSDVSVTLVKNLIWEQEPEQIQIVPISPTSSPQTKRKATAKKDTTQNDKAKEARAHLIQQFDPLQSSATLTPSPILSCVSSPLAAVDAPSTLTLIQSDSSPGQAPETDGFMEGCTAATDNKNKPVGEDRSSDACSLRSCGCPRQPSQYSFKERLQEAARRIASHCKDSDTENSSPSPSPCPFTSKSPISPSSVGTRPELPPRWTKSTARTPPRYSVKGLAAEIDNGKFMGKDSKSGNFTVRDGISPSNTSSDLCSVCNDNSATSCLCSDSSAGTSAHAQCDGASTPGSSADPSPVYPSPSPNSRPDDSPGSGHSECSVGSMDDADTFYPLVQPDGNISTSNNSHLYRRVHKKSHVVWRLDHGDKSRSDTDTDQSLDESLIERVVGSTVVEALERHTNSLVGLISDAEIGVQGVAAGRPGGGLRFALSDFDVENEDEALTDMSDYLEHSDLNSDLDDI